MFMLRLRLPLTLTLSPPRGARGALAALAAGVRRAIQAAVGCSDIQARHPRVAEGATHGRVSRSGMRFEDRAAGRDDDHGRRRSALRPAHACDQVALAVEAHAFDAALHDSEG